MRRGTKGGLTTPTKNTSIQRMSPKEAPNRKQLAVILSSDLVERAKNIVYWTPGVTLAGLVEEGLIKTVERWERANGGPYEARPADLQRGRPALDSDSSGKKKAAGSSSGSQGSRRPTPKAQRRNTRKRG